MMLIPPPIGVNQKLHQICLGNNGVSDTSPADLIVVRSYRGAPCIGVPGVKSLPARITLPKRSRSAASWSAVLHISSLLSSYGF
jgi:hypothetical protein